MTMVITLDVVVLIAGILVGRWLGVPAAASVTLGALAASWLNLGLAGANLWRAERNLRQLKRDA
jgi:hypothetical protein